MSIRRLVVTATAMALFAVGLAALTPDAASMAATLARAQRTADTTGPDAVAVAAAGLLAWAVWVWGVLGLALTAVSALPGAVGGAARVVLHVVVPAGARRGAALALGLGLGVAGPLLDTAAFITTTPASAAAPEALPTAEPVPDWPAPPASADSAPDWPTAHLDAHVVVRGDCLWHIAGARLLAEHGRTPTEGEVAAATHAWWLANAEVIGADPDLLLPGQVLTPPGRP